MLNPHGLLSVMTVVLPLLLQLVFPLVLLPPGDFGAGWELGLHVRWIVDPGSLLEYRVLSGVHPSYSSDGHT